jgi:MerR family transcriptional regulator, thiopeptide resistance regulator
MDPADPAMTVGALARATGVTVRALHHYDRLGLLRPGRDPGGRRRYGPAEVRRLHQIIVLRSFGLPLGEIAQVLDGAGPDPRDLLRRQLRRTEEQLAALGRLHGTLRSLIAAWPPGGAGTGTGTGVGGGVGVSQLIELIERTTAVTEKLTMEQFEQMSRQRAEAMAALSPEEVAGMQRQRAEQASKLSPEELAAMEQRRREMLPDGVA